MGCRTFLDCVVAAFGRAFIFGSPRLHVAGRTIDGPLDTLADSPSLRMAFETPICISALLLCEVLPNKCATMNGYLSTAPPPPPSSRAPPGKRPQTAQPLLEFVKAFNVSRAQSRPPHSSLDDCFFVNFLMARQINTTLRSEHSFRLNHYLWCFAL